MMYRDRRLLEIVRDAPCMVCFNQDGTVVAAHSNQLKDGKGRSIKAHDFRIAAMCYRCHTRCDQGADLSKAERVEMWEGSPPSHHCMAIPEWQTQGGWLTFSNSQAYSRSVDSPRLFPSPSRVTGKPPAPGLSGGFFGTVCLGAGSAQRPKIARSPWLSPLVYSQRYAGPRAWYRPPPSEDTKCWYLVSSVTGKIYHRLIQSHSISFELFQISAIL
jgi:hypothetical protein